MNWVIIVYELMRRITAMPEGIGNTFIRYSYYISVIKCYLKADEYKEKNEPSRATTRIFFLSLIETQGNHVKCSVKIREDRGK